MIDEKKLIETINNRIKYWDAKTDEYVLKADERNMTSCNGIAIGLRMAIETIESHPKTGEWIPVTERLPKESETVLVTYETIDDRYVHTADYGRGKWWMGAICRDKGVTAWMPCPEAYVGDEDDSTM